MLAAPQALGGQPVGDAHPGRFGEMAGQGPAAHRRHLRQRVEIMRFANVLLKILKQAVYPRVAGVFRYRLGDKLRLAALTVRWDDHPPGDLIGDKAAKALANEIQATVERRRGTRRGDNPLIVNVQRVDIQPHLRKQALKILLKLPVGRRAPVVQQPGVAEYKRPEAQADDLRAVIARANQAVQQRLRRALIYRPPVGHHHDIRLLQEGKIAAGVQRESIAGAQQPGPFGANMQVKAFGFRDRIAK